METPLRTVRMRAISFFFVLLALAAALSLAHPAVARAADLEPIVSNNAWMQNYFSHPVLRTTPVYWSGYEGNYAIRVSSYLNETSDGMLERVEHTDNQLIVERYTSAYDLVSQRTIDASTYTPSSLTGDFEWGGFYSGTLYNFVVTGQDNPNSSDSVPVVRITSYTKDWSYVDSIELSAINTTYPFDFGSCRMLEFQGSLILRTCHVMYNGHQANMTFIFGINDSTGSLTCTSSFYNVSNIGNTASFGYVSHSMNQWLATDGSNVYALDHGDAYPRCISVKRIYPSCESGYSSLLSFSGSTGDNFTGATVGGFACTGSSQVAVGDCVSANASTSNTYTVRNIWFGSTTTGFTWLTDYDADGTDSATTPQLVKVNDNRFLVIWTKRANNYGTEATLYYEFVDASGNALSQVYEATGAQSDCQPTVKDGKAVWYASKDLSTTYQVQSLFAFYSIDLATGEFGRVTLRDDVHAHTAGEATRENLSGNPCTEDYTYDLVYYCSICGKEMRRTMGLQGSAMGHSVVDAKSNGDATCTADGTKTGTCERCGATITVADLGSALGHDLTEKAVVDPTCTSQGYTTYACTRCSYSCNDSYTDPLGHDTVTTFVDATCTDMSYEVNSCTRCGLSWKNPIASCLGHDYAVWTRAGEGRTSSCKRCGEKFYTSQLFSDVTDSSVWYFDWVYQSYDLGLFSGYSDSDKFGPSDTLSRAMVVTLLYRAYTGETATSTNNNVPSAFPDVASGQWYAAAVQWAAQTGITTGMDGRFYPDAPVTREQLATFLARYAAYVASSGTSTDAASVLSFDYSRLYAMPDASSVSGFAVDGMAWCTANGVITGKNTDAGKLIDPQAGATRAEMAKMIVVTVHQILKQR